MEEFITKDDLRQFGLLMTDTIRNAVAEAFNAENIVREPEWLKSKAVRKMLDISAGSVQNLRTSQKVRFKKVLGSYYYNREDIQKLFIDEKD
ncbi:helix-turn-helix domain-containing protein [Flavobacterium fluviatile]|uniref:helix-turn-helix domain-containing protein n=1 Tax=Flavobacterium fluviatile TaxID=1862387 RepID=UPI0013D556B0|nr:helix-turn-helix domain-containing protein [Flavobacterium fluviatile]